MVAKSVDEYVGWAPEGLRGKLEEVRAAVRRAAPHAVEGISYRLPYYSYKGQLAWFGLYTNYISLYVRPPVIQDHPTELRGYVTTKSAVHIPLDRKTPTALIEKLVRAAVRQNESRTAPARG